jgi:hypothetical protein
LFFAESIVRVVGSAAAQTIVATDIVVVAVGLVTGAELEVDTGLVIGVVIGTGVGGAVGVKTGDGSAEVSGTIGRGARVGAGSSERIELVDGTGTRVSSGVVKGTKGV